MDIQVAIFHHRATAEDLLSRLIERRILLDAEVVADQVERDVGGVANGGNIGGAVPGRAHAERLGKRGDLAGGREAPGLRQVHADVIDETIRDQRDPFVGAVKQFAHGERRRAL